MNTWRDRNEEALKIINDYFCIENLSELEAQMEDGILYGKSLNLHINFNENDDIESIDLEPLSEFDTIYERNE